ncbi:PepSY-like domain-containing protein [Flavobacterium cerinum]|uniref:PepSY-like domain-containing protein n=1 Tax=Flavobacterium cerinum TaxID=2502784 RepID=A0ABY5IRN0_9FLAO|nr:PepSY-like domain-containing protein [Flavobacterium cerinum]UUC45526.1 PepSY-like domain-containing protein [Flavobacterium cerinum]
MKTILKSNLTPVVLLLILLTGFTVQAQKTNIKMAQLPANAQNFLKKHYPKQTPNYILKDEETFSLDYKVQLADGTEIEFDRKGNWEEVDGNKNTIPNSIIPAPILTYVQNHYKGAAIVKIDKGAWDYEVDLNNGLELKFNSKGEFLRVDD